jgi:UDP-glucose 4-epimerase
VRILITGGAGFIGANLAKRLVERGDSVVVLDDLSTGSLSNIHGLNLEFIEGSILEGPSLTKAVAGVESIIHLAAVPSVPRSIKDPMRSHHANATGTLLVLEAARSAGAHVAVASSSSVYGSNPTLPKNEDLATRPLSPYAGSKLAAEGYTLAYAASYGLETIPFRFFNVYGPLQAAGHAYAAVIPTWLDAALAGRPVQINGDGLHSRDFTYVDTVTRVLADAATRRVASEVPVNLALGTNTTLLELLGVMEEQLGYRIERDHRDPRPGDVKASQADSAVLRRLFPDVAATPLEDGIGATVSWFHSTGARELLP